jgi:hypothetical protein
MQTQPNQKVVELTPIDAAPTHGPWQVDHDGNGSNQSSSYPIIDLPKGSGPWTIQFRLKGQSDVKFSGDPIWVKEGGKPGSKANHSQIPAADVTVAPNGKLLTIKDLNNNDGTIALHYRLNFTGDQKHETLDPIIKNGGGTTRDMQSLEVAQLVLSGAILLTLLFVAYQQVAAKRVLAEIQRWISKR